MSRFSEHPGSRDWASVVYDHVNDGTPCVRVIDNANGLHRVNGVDWSGGGGLLMGELLDNDGDWVSVDTSTSVFTIHRAGVYRFTVNVTFHAPNNKDYQYKIVKDPIGDAPVTGTLLRGHCGETTSAQDKASSSGFVSLCDCEVGDTYVLAICRLDPGSAAVTITGLTMLVERLRRA